MIAALGCHIYAGGFTLGVGKHFTVLAHLEHEGYGSGVVRLNFPELPVYTGGPAKWPDFSHERPRFIFANPPCAIWSQSSSVTRGAWHLDPRLAVHHDIFNYAMDMVSPDVLVIESVAPSFTRGRRHWDALADKGRSYGYAMTCIRHNAQWLGVAQVRPRIFYAFHKVAIPWQLPDFGPPITVREAFNGLRKTAHPLPNVSADTMALLKLAKPGQNLHRIFMANNPEPKLNQRGLRSGAPSFLYRRLPWDKPSTVPLAAFHPELNRFITLEEFAAICSFPQDYRWPKTGYAEIAAFMNRGVMPKVGEWLAGQVYEGLMQDNRLNDLSPMVFDASKPPGGYGGLEAVPEAPYPEQRPPHARVLARQAYLDSVTEWPAREDGEKSGAFIRRCLLNWTADPDLILKAVRAQFPGSKAVRSDVNWNVGKLKQMGLFVPRNYDWTK